MKTMSVKMMTLLLGEFVRGGAARDQQEGH